MIGTGPGMAEVFRLMESAAASPIAVLVEGETGTGKELVALRIEQQYRSPFGREHLSALGHDEGDQLIQLEPRRERAPKLVEEPKPSLAVGLRHFGRHRW